MKITTKLAAASFLLIALLVGVLTYDLSVVRGLAAAQEELTAAEYRAMTLALEQRRLLARLEDLTRKLFVTRDPDYAAGIEQTRQAFEVLLGELESLRLSADGAAIVARLAEEWHALPLAALAEQAVAVEPGSEEDQLLLSSFLGLSQKLRDQANEVASVAERTVADRVVESAAISRKARTFSWIAAISALTLTLPTLWLTISSIRKPLQRFHEGAQSVARGEYSYRIDDLDEGEFSELATKFNEMIRSLDRRERRGRDVLSHLSHELKTPLVAMQETNRLLLDGLSGRLTSKQRRVIELNQESSERLGEMITKLLDFARLEEGVLQFDPQPNDLVHLTGRAVEAFSARAAKARVALRISAPDEELSAVCDGDRIMQIVMNLLDNAIKFSPPDSTVTITVDRVDGGKTAPSRTAIVEVADCGPGVPENKREAIFERFTQLEGAKRSGIGLGLAISRQIAEAHRGALTVDSNEQGGSTFSLMLPLSTTAHAVTGALT